MRFKLISDLKELRRTWAELFERADVDEAASYELAVSARRFSRRTQEAVDDKLNFTATLVRAGEVDAANRLFAEFEREVLVEEAALIEKVNEVRVAQAIRREKITRLRLARALAACFVGSALVASSAFASVLVKSITDENPSTQAPGAVGFSSISSQLDGIAKAAKQVRKVKVAGINIKMNRNQLREFKQLTDGAVDPGKLQQFLMGILPATLAEQVQEALVSAAGTIESASTVEADVVEEVKVIEEAKKAEETQAAEEETEAKPSPEPSPSGDDGDRKKKRSGDGDGDRDGDDPGGSPLPLGGLG